MAERTDGDVWSGELGTLAQTMRDTFQTVEHTTEAFIREAILQGIYRPGQRLFLGTIASHLGVSHMPVRVSLRQLEAEGLVHSHPRRGVTVSSLLPGEVAEIYELRILLETYLLERAMPKFDAKKLRVLRTHAEKIELTDSASKSLEVRKEFYQALYGLANRPRALAEADKLRAAVGRYYLLTQVFSEHGVHTGLLSRIENGDLGGAKEWLTDHLLQVSEELQRLVDKFHAVSSGKAG